MQKVLTELRQRHAGRLRVKSINVIEEPRQIGEWRVKVIPTQVFLDGEGREIHRHLGYLSAQAVEERFRSHGIDLGASRSGAERP
jgi:thioredoxin 1